jgi:hypothetical protein
VKSRNTYTRTVHDFRDIRPAEGTMSRIGTEFVSLPALRESALPVIGAQISSQTAYE